MHPSAERLYKAAALLRHTTGQSAVARLLTQSPQVLKNWESRGVSKDGALNAQNELGASATWILDGRGPMEMPQGGAPTPRTAEHPVTGVAHDVSRDDSNIPPFIDWEALMANNVTPDEFRTRAPDDALAPRLRAGQVLTLNRRLQPRPGDGVLITDKAGGRHLRIYRPGVGRWEAHASHPDYPALDSERDGLQVLAVLTGVEARWG